MLKLNKNRFILNLITNFIFIWGSFSSAQKSPTKTVSNLNTTMPLQKDIGSTAICKNTNPAWHTVPVGTSPLPFKKNT